MLYRLLLQDYCFIRFWQWIDCLSGELFWDIIHGDLQHRRTQILHMHDHHCNLLHYPCTVKTGWMYSAFPLFGWIFHVLYSSPCHYLYHNRPHRSLYFDIWVWYVPSFHIHGRLQFSSICHCCKHCYFYLWYSEKIILYLLVDLLSLASSDYIFKYLIWLVHVLRVVV